MEEEDALKPGQKKKDRMREKYGAGPCMSPWRFSRHTDLRVNVMWRTRKEMWKNKLEEIACDRREEMSNWPGKAVS
jgi:hypothetical protein